MFFTVNRFGIICFLISFVFLYYTFNKAYQSSIDIQEEKIYRTQAYGTDFNFDETEKRLLDRRKYVQNQCSILYRSQALNSRLVNFKSTEYLINKKHNLVWCNIFKSASSTWMFYFNILAGYGEDFLRQTSIPPILLTRKRYPRPNPSELSEAVKYALAFIIVRHPFQRLLSFYRNKFENKSRLHEYIPVINWVKLKRKERKVEVNVTSDLIVPTFEEFVEYILTFDVPKPPKMDYHWVPMTEFCSPCFVDLDLILKFEHLEDEEPYLFMKANLLEYLKPVWINKSSDRVKGEQTIDYNEKYFSQLKKSQIEKLGNFYKYDLNVFDYSTDDYLKHGQNG